MAPSAGRWRPTATSFPIATPRRGCFVWLSLVLGGCNDLAESPERTVSVQQPPAAPWPQELFVRDTSVLALEVTDDQGVRVTGLHVAWQSSDEDVVETRAIPPATTSHEDSLLAQLRIQIVTHRRGDAEISARVEQPGLAVALISQVVRVKERWSLVSAGGDHTCGLTIDHAAYCWGSGLLGNGFSGVSLIPTRVAGDLQFTTLAAGRSFTCGISAEGIGYCWGNNESGELGNGTTSDRFIPAPISSGVTLTSITAGSAYACALSGTSGYCWGFNTLGQLGDARVDRGFSLPTPDPPFDNCAPITGDVRCSKTPRQVRNPDEEDGPVLLSAIGPSEEHTCGLLNDGKAICWGQHARWGNLSLMPSDASIPVPGSLVFGALTSGLFHSCAIEKGANAVHCWGYDTYGQLGNPAAASNVACDTAPCSLVPVPVQGAAKFVQVSAGGNTTCATTEAGDGFCWGSNEFGQLGNGDSPLITTCHQVACSLEPVQMRTPAGSHLASISVGRQHACGVAFDGAAYCWGDGSGGKLGNNTTTRSAIPVRVEEPRD